MLDIELYKEIINLVIIYLESEVEIEDVDRFYSYYTKGYEFAPAIFKNCSSIMKDLEQESNPYTKNCKLLCASKLCLLRLNLKRIDDAYSNTKFTEEFIRFIVDKLDIKLPIGLML